MATILSFLLLIVVVVGVHEWGHYIAARCFGVWVRRFSIGFGKPIWSHWDDNGTEWVIAPIPLGGYVQMLDEMTVARLSEKGKAAAVGKTIESKSDWQRFIIYAAGPLANVVFSLLIVTAIYYFNGREGLAAEIGGVRPGSPAAVAGITAGTKIVSINGDKVVLWKEAGLALVDAVLEEAEINIIGDNGRRWTIAAKEVPARAVEDDVLLAIGLFPNDEFLRPTVARIQQNSAADFADIEEGDEIIALDDTIVDYWRDLALFVKTRPQQPVKVIVWRDDAPVTLRATLDEVTENGKKIGRLGVVPTFVQEKYDDLLVKINYTFFQSLWLSGKQNLNDIARTFIFLGHIIGGDLSLKNISGPVGIAEFAGTAAELGLVAWLRFVALISVSLAAMNLIPLPVLDGGQMVICMIQSAMRRPLPKVVLQALERVGVVLVLFLILGVIFNDMSKLMGG